MFQRDHANVFICPFALVVFNQPGKRQWTKNKVNTNSLRLYFTSSTPSIPLVGYAILKDFSYLLGAKFTEKKFVHVMTIDQWEIEGFSMT